jgi:RNA polymerase sigma-70 factor (sigma-E family)
MVNVASAAAVPDDGLFTAVTIGASGDGSALEAEVPMRSPTLRSATTAAAVMAELHRAHYQSLVASAGLYLGVLADAEDAVQGAFVEVWDRWERIRTPDKALLYLRRAVFNTAKSQLRHRQVVDRHPPVATGPAASSEECVIARLTDERVVSAVRSLPGGQRDCLVLRLGLDLSEKETARVLKVSVGTVKKQLSRARQRLGPILEDMRYD